MRRRAEVVALLGILALAFGLREWGIGWGMPYVFHSDEPKYLPRAVTMLLTGDPNPHYFDNPPLLTYLYLAGLLPYLWVGQLLGKLRSAMEVAEQLQFSPTLLYIGARSAVAVLGTATVLATYLAGRRLLGPGASLAGSLLLAVAFLHVRDSHYAVNDVPATFLLMVSFYFATRVLGSRINSSPPRTQNSEPRTQNPDYLLAGLFLGLAVATKYNVGLGAVALVAAHLLRPRKPGEVRSVSAHLPLVGAGIVSLLAFLAANPYALLDWPGFLKGFASQYGWTADPYRTSDLSVGATILRALAMGVGVPMLVGALLGLGLRALRRPREALLLVSFPLAYLAFFLAGSDLFYARFALPLLPFVALLAGYGVKATAGWLPPGLPRVGVGVAAVALLALPSAALDLRHNGLLRAEDTRLLLGRWIEANVPPGSKIALEGYTFQDAWGQYVGPKKIPYQVAIYPSLRTNSLERYAAEGISYLLASSYVYGRYGLSDGAHQEAVEIYQRMERELPLVASFHPTAGGWELPFLMDDEITPFYTVMERERPGPSLRVYRVGEEPRYRVEWLAAPVPERMAPGQRLEVSVVVRNAGNLVWPAGGYTPVRLGYRWLDASGREVPAPDPRGPLPRDLAPGEEATILVPLQAPSSPGTYTLRLDLVQENFAWLSARGAESKEMKVEIPPP